MTAETLLATLALIGLVIIAASLVSGLAERTGLPPVAIFLALGALLGPAGLGIIAFGFDSPVLRIIATLALVLILFTDAITVDLAEVRRHRRLALLVLGPGTLLPAALITLAARFILDVSWPAAAILGGALASTDPVMLRGLLRRPALPADTRLALRLESGLNDVLLLPVVVIAMLFLGPAAPRTTEVAGFSAGLFLLGPAAGAFTGFVAIKLLETMRARFGVRRDYESMYALGVALTAFAAAEAVHGSGFLAAFTAGITIAALDVELCDCFTDFGQAAGEMFLLLTFVAFGAGLIWRGFAAADAGALAFIPVALLARTAVLWPALGRLGLERRSRAMIAWYGPRGLSSLLLVLLPVFAALPGSARLFDVTCLVVLASLVVHGAMLAVSEGRGSRVEGRAVPAPAPPQVDRASDAVANRDLPAGERISIEEVRERQARGEPVVIGDVRTERSWAEAPQMARGAVRLSPDDAVAAATRLAVPKGALLALYCT